MLTTVIFGLPSGFLLLICYSIHCSDILDADDDDDADDGKFPSTLILGLSHPQVKRSPSVMTDDSCKS